MNGKAAIEFFEIGRDVSRLGPRGFFPIMSRRASMQIGNIESKSWAPTNAAETPFGNLTRLIYFQII
jgi:hypothetical protein